MIKKISEWFSPFKIYERNNGSYIACTPYRTSSGTVLSWKDVFGSLKEAEEHIQIAKEEWDKEKVAAEGKRIKRRIK